MSCYHVAWLASHGGRHAHANGDASQPARLRQCVCLRADLDTCLSEENGAVSVRDDLDALITVGSVAFL